MKSLKQVALENALDEEEVKTDPRSVIERVMERADVVQAARDMRCPRDYSNKKYLRRDH